jgi:hypothetical protein
LKSKKEISENKFNIIFYLTQYIPNISLFNPIYPKYNFNIKLLKVFYILFLSYCLQELMCDLALSAHLSAAQMYLKLSAAPCGGRAALDAPHPTPATQD